MKYIQKFTPEDIKETWESGTDINLILPNKIVDLHSFILYYSAVYMPEDTTEETWKCYPPNTSCVIDQLRIIVNGKEACYLQEYNYLDAMLRDLRGDDNYNNTTNGTSTEFLEIDKTTDVISSASRNLYTNSEQPADELCSITKWLGFLGEGNRYLDCTDKRVEIQIRLAHPNILYNSKPVGPDTKLSDKFLLKNIYGTIKICDHDPEKLPDFEYTNYTCKIGQKCGNNKKTSLSLKIKKPTYWGVGTFLNDNRKNITQGDLLQLSDYDDVYGSVSSSYQHVNNALMLLNNSKYFSRNGAGIDSTSWEINNYQVTPLMNNLMIMNETKNLFNTEYELCRTPFHFQNEFFVNGLDISMNDDELKNIQWNINIQQNYKSLIGTPVLFLCYRDKL